MYLCYVDESGTSEIPGNSAYFVLAGVAIPIWHWKTADRDINQIKCKYGLADAEIHTAWILRPYPEQFKVPNFDQLAEPDRRRQVEALRRTEIFRLQKSGNSKLLKQTKKNYRKTEAYIHLTFDQRRSFVQEIAKLVGSWGFARLFAECVDKVNFNSGGTVLPDYQAFEQVISRFEHYLNAVGPEAQKTYGLIIHDNNETVAKKHTELMREFHRSGTFFQRIQCIIETPLFVNSELTGMVQIADLCAYALRRYFENGEKGLFDEIFKRADRRDGKVVGVRHYTPAGCSCEICTSRGRL